MNILNLSGNSVVADELRTPQELAKYLQSSMLQLKGSHMSTDGKGVDYAGLGSGEAFKEYLNVSGQLASCDPSSLTEKEKMAFFISILAKQTFTGRRLCLVDCHVKYLFGCIVFKL